MRSVFWNEEEARLRAGWRVMLQLLIFLVLLIGPAVLVVPWLVGTPWAESSFGAVGSARRGSEVVLPPLLLLSGWTLLAALASVWLAGRFLDRRALVGFGLRLDRNWWRDLGFGLALGAFLMGAIFAVELAAGWAAITGTFSTSADQPFIWPLLGFLVVFLCGGIYEELIARGYQLTNLAEGLNFRGVGPERAVLLGWGLSSALFGLLHAGNPHATMVSVLNTMVGGAMMGWGYVLTGQLAIPIGLHVGWNFFQANVFGFPVSGWDAPAQMAALVATTGGGPDLWTGGAYGPEAGLLGLGASLLGLPLISAWVRATRGGRRLYTGLAPRNASGATDDADA